jgi:hypothetical protein
MEAILGFPEDPDVKRRIDEGSKGDGGEFLHV